MRYAVVLGCLLIVISVVYLALPNSPPPVAGVNVTPTNPEPASVGAANFTIVVLPDTQWYSRNYSAIFLNQTLWITSQLKERNIVFVAHEGDIVYTADSNREWQNANASISVLDGKVPYSLLPGNHDKPTVLYNRYFPPARYSDNGWYGGNYSGNDNSYYMFSAGGDDYILLSLGICPAQDVIRWANKVLQSHLDRKAIVVTHGYLNEKAQRNVNICGSTEYIWDDLIKPNPSVFLVLCGHMHAAAMRQDEVGGRRVYQLLADYQDDTSGGDGWLRLLEFAPQDKRIYVKTYSPYLDKYETDSGNQFVLDI